MWASLELFMISATNYPSGQSRCEKEAIVRLDCMNHNCNAEDAGGRKLLSQPDRDHQVPDAAGNTLPPEPSQAIMIPRPGHTDPIQASKTDAVLEGSKLQTSKNNFIKSGRNKFGELMPRVPVCIRPYRAFRHKTKAPGTCRWNAITASWIDSDNGSARGTWGHSIDPGKKTRQSSNDKAIDRGLFASDIVLAARPHTTKSNQVKRCDIKQQACVDNAQRNWGIPARSNLSGAASTPLTLEEFRRLAIENECAVESYRPCVEGTDYAGIQVG